MRGHSQLSRRIALERDALRIINAALGGDLAGLTNSAVIRWGEAALCDFDESYRQFVYQRIRAVATACQAETDMSDVAFVEGVEYDVESAMIALKSILSAKNSCLTR